VASPFVSVRATRAYAVEQALHKLGYRATLQDSLVGLWQGYLERREQGASTADLDAQIRRLPDFVPTALRPGLSTEPEVGPVFNSIHLDQTGEWRGLRLPFLALFGERDEVVPVASSVTRLRDVLGPDTRDLEVLVVPGVDHSFTYAGWQRQRFRFEEVIAAWVLARTGQLEECNLQLEMIEAQPEQPVEEAALLVYRPCATMTGSSE
jgi:pimeloyl-ACP methyl ester carboxylesterase